MCETRVAPPYYAPSASYKLSSEWAQHTYDRQVSSWCADQRSAGESRLWLVVFVLCVIGLCGWCVVGV